MALENKKSLLQPSSTQAQQSRLQFSNLAPGGVAPVSLTSRQPLPIGNARPATSVYVNAPAPVSLTAPPTIPPVIATPPPPPTPNVVRVGAPAPTPAAAVAPATPSIAVNYRDTATYFDAETLLTSSISSVDLPFDLHGRFGIMLAIKPDAWAGNQTLLHMYTGSFASESLEIRIQNDTLQLYAATAGSYVRRGVNVDPAKRGKLGNGYTLITLNKFSNNTNRLLADPSFNWFVNDESIQGWIDQGGQGTMTGSFTNLTSADHLEIGGTDYSPLAPTQPTYYTGSVAFMAFRLNAGFSRQDTLDVMSGKVTPAQLATKPGMLRVYEFSNGVAVEYTGSAATVQVPLGLTGSVYPNQLDSYYV
jgi:hypothetical protein